MAAGTYIVFLGFVSCRGVYADVPFVNSHCHFQDTFDMLLRVFLLKIKKRATQSRTQTFGILVSLRYHYTTKPTHQNSEKFKFIN